MVYWSKTLNKQKLKKSEAFGDLNKFEEILTKYLWVIMFLLTGADAWINYITGQLLLYQKVFYLQCISFFFIICITVFRILNIKKHRLKSDLIYTIIKLLEILSIIVLVNTINHGIMISFVILLPLISINITKGFKASIPYLGFALAAQIAARHIISYYTGAFQGGFTDENHFIFYIIYAILFTAFFVFLKILGACHEQFLQSERDNDNLVSQLGRKYAQLEEAKLEKQEQYDELKEVNKQLEESNSKLTASLAEFFTLQQISQAISSLFDMDELLRFVNDAIIGVMGVSTSNIALYSGERLIVRVSNINNNKDRAILIDNINNSVLNKAVEQGVTIKNNNVDPDKYDFTKGRNVKSFLCVPLQTKVNKHGFVLIEHNIPEAFSESNIRLLEIITQQVSIAIENARLYEQLQTYANTDGLTQVYTRLFFQNRLTEELKQAKEDGYEVSVILYDIDDFKKFNDTYGHLFGDIVLKSLARLVKDSVRKNDIVARFGGEEFIILLSHTNMDNAVEKAEEIRQKVSDLVVRDKDVAASVTISMGVSSFPGMAQTEDSLLKSADIALYNAKKSGKNCVKAAEPKNSN